MFRRGVFIRNSEFLYKKNLNRAAKTQEKVDFISKTFHRQAKIFAKHPIMVNLTAVAFVGLVLYYDYTFSFDGVLPVLNPITHLQYNLQVDDFNNNDKNRIHGDIPSGTIVDDSNNRNSRHQGGGGTAASATVDYLRSSLNKKIEGEKQVYFLDNHTVTSPDPTHMSPAELELRGSSEHQIQKKNSSSSSISSLKNATDAELAGEPANPFKMNVIGGHLDHRDSFWSLRNNERNWSIMAQDRQRQMDNYLYRKERSKDDDYGRQSFV